MMMWNNRRKWSSNTFLWGTILGMVGGLYLSRMMNHTSHRENSHHDHDQHNDQRNDAKQFPKHNKTSEASQHSMDNIDIPDKEKLFEAFMNSSESEIKAKANELNLKN